MLALFRKPPPPPPALAVGPTPANDGWLRPRGDAYVRIGGRDYPLRAWSPDGFHIAPYDGTLVPRQRARVTLVVRDFHDKDGTLTLTDEVVVDRVDGTGLVAHWRPLPPAKREALAAYHRRKLTN